MSFACNASKIQIARFKKAKIIINPTANHGEASKFIEPVSQFFEDKVSSEIVLTKQPGHASEIATKLQEFDLVVAVGGDGTAFEVANGLAESSRSGILLYLTALFRILFKDYYCHPVRIKIDDGDWIEQEVVLVAVNNGVSYGGGFLITPRARNDDGLLEACIVDKLTKWQIIPRLPFVILGKHSWMRQIYFTSAKKVVIESDKELAAHLDGELMIAKRFDIKIVPKALKVVVGKGVQCI